MNERLMLYHGSDHIVATPTFGQGKLHNDFGLGFYCTAYENLAIRRNTKQ